MTGENTLLIHRTYPLPSGGGESAIAIDISINNFAITASEVRLLAYIMSAAEEAANGMKHRAAGGKGSTA